jgi:DNA replication and repair protein RecF
MLFGRAPAGMRFEYTSALFQARHDGQGQTHIPITASTGRDTTTSQRLIMASIWAPGARLSPGGPGRPLTHRYNFNEERARWLRDPRLLRHPGHLARVLPQTRSRDGVLLRELVLVNFRNYVRLALTPGDPITVLVGDNGQGKSNVLEAIYLLATTRSPRTSNDRELVHWRARRDVIPFARLEARIHRDDSELHVEILIKAENDAAASGAAAPADSGGTVPSIRPVTKQVKVNGLPTRAVELIGQVNVVLFTPDDVALVAGSPSVRRRYLDITISQVNGQYLRALQRYNRVLVQRNNLLRQVRERRQPRDQLEFWNDELVRLGAFIVARRVETVATLNRDVAPLFRDLGGSQHDLALDYQPTSHDPAALGADTSGLAGLYAARVRDTIGREIDAGVSLVGPHRDDFAFMVDGVDLHDYGSRGQQRLAVVALKLAEAQFMRRETEEQPILLLDDILSELDPVRRGYVLGQAGRAGQTLITTTDLDDFGADLLGRAAVVRVERGSVTPLGPSNAVHERPVNGELYGPSSPTLRVAEQPLDPPGNPE